MSYGTISKIAKQYGRDRTTITRIWKRHLIVAQKTVEMSGKMWCKTVGPRKEVNKLNLKNVL